MGSGHISFADSAKEALDALREATDAEGFKLRWRAAHLVKRFGSWVAAEPTPEEKQSAVNELIAVMTAVSQRRAAGTLKKAGA